MARWVLTSGSLSVDDNGLRLDPDRLWAGVFRPEGGWYVARWPDLARIELRQGGRYSVLRARLCIFDQAGQSVFRGEVDWRDAKSLLTHSAPEYANLQAQRMPGRLSAWRFQRV